MLVMINFDSKRKNKQELLKNLKIELDKALDKKKIVLDSKKMEFIFRAFKEIISKLKKYIVVPYHYFNAELLRLIDFDKLVFNAIKYCINYTIDDGNENESVIYAS